MVSIKDQFQSVEFNRPDDESCLTESALNEQCDDVQNHNELIPPPTKRIRQSPPPPANVLVRIERHSSQSAETKRRKQKNAVGPSFILTPKLQLLI